jgi:hypothetical protein
MIPRTHPHLNSSTQTRFACIGALSFSAVGIMPRAGLSTSTKPTFLGFAVCILMAYIDGWLPG